MKINWNIKYLPTEKHKALGLLNFKIGWILIGLKLFSLISWSWWYVLIPFELSVFCFICWFLMQLFLYLLDKLINKIKQNKMTISIPIHPIFRTTYLNSKKGFSYVFFALYIVFVLLKFTALPNLWWGLVDLPLTIGVVSYVVFCFFDFVLWVLNYKLNKND